MVRIENPKFPISNGLLEPRHVEAIGSAIWVYLCLIDWQDCDDGKVKNGETVTLPMISARLGCNDRTARRGLERLQSEGYINRVKRQHGWTITITRPKKRMRRDKSVPEGVTKVSKPRDKSVKNDNSVNGHTTSSPVSTKQDLQRDPLPSPPPFDPETEFVRLKEAYPKDALINGFVTMSAWVEVVCSAADPGRVLAEVWAGLERMKASGTPVKFMPTLKDFLLNGRFRERWPKEQEDPIGKLETVAERMARIRKEKA